MKIFTAVMAGAVLIGGISVGAEALKNEDTKETLKQVQVAEPSGEKAGITLAEASDIVLAKVENGVIHEAEKDRANGRLVYEIEVKNDEYEFEFKVDAENGEIIKEEKDERRGGKAANGENGNSGNTANAKDEAVISIGEAKGIAKKEVPGELEDIELERENGKLVYEVEIKNHQNGDDDDVSVYVDAITGKVLYVEWDD
ncbi:PepSY domain-containing protein [Sutcliffiella horikoshii]|uniref:PepSY domain-containing protein n=1 Tax=Sutcliffiella horikoshii TaxID=79883 RepID=UPI001CC0F14B|nr:PepSY domain-containing protein [Sutcliffiella horikoshii]UAL47663.1 PepSY domain-containing protein [Sutcliffiella horikoshii]